MDFPSREEARAFLRLQEESVGSSASSPRPAPPGAEDTIPPAPGANGSPGESTCFRVEKPGYETDVFDRRALRNLIRTGEVVETDRIRVDDSAPVPASDLPYLKSLFKMARAQSIRPPACCRTHTDRVAFFRCHDTNRPLCESCAPEKKFGGQMLRVCQHCGGTALDLHTA
jgi:hypothetical protein